MPIGNIMVIFAICSSSFDKKVDNVGKLKKKNCDAAAVGDIARNFCFINCGVDNVNWPP